jgi:hypothetical protein
LALLSAALVVASAAGAGAKPGHGGGGGGGGGAAGPYSLTFYTCGPGPSEGFTKGTSVDGGAKAVTVDGANCVTGTNNNPFAISFTNFWNTTTTPKGLADVAALKMSTQNPITQGGSPRISIEMYDGVNDFVESPLGAGDSVIYLNPATCGTTNAQGWTTSDFRSAPSCVITDSSGNTFANWADMLTVHTSDKIWFAFVIADQPTVNRIDRIVLDNQVFTG